MGTKFKIQQVENNLDSLNKELEKRIDFLKVEIKCDKEKARRRYEEEYKQNVNGIKEGRVSFNQWLAEREMEALMYMISLY